MLEFFPQITQIDADYIPMGPSIYLRYLRHLRAELGGRVDRETRIEYLAQEHSRISRRGTICTEAS